MSALYWLLGTGVGITSLLLYLRYTIKQREKLQYQNEILNSQKEYRDEVIEQLSKPRTIDDTIDSLRDGKF